MRNVGKLQLLPYPLYRYAIVLLVFPLEVNRLFLLFSSNIPPFALKATVTNVSKLVTWKPLKIVTLTLFYIANLIFENITFFRKTLKKAPLKIATFSKKIY